MALNMDILSLFRKKNQPIETKSYGPIQEYIMYDAMSGRVTTFSGLAVNEIIKNYQSVAPLKDGIDLISAAIASLPIKLRDKKTLKEIESHKVLDLLKFPNHEDQKTQKDFLSQLAIWKIISGNYYINATGLIKQDPRELYILNPQSMTLQLDSKNTPASYTYNSGSDNEIFQRDITTNRFINSAKTGELIHISSFNPFVNSASQGQSELLSIMLEILQYKSSSTANLAMLENGLRPSGAMVLKSKDGQTASLTVDQYDRLQEQLTAGHAGSSKSGKPMLLEGGLEWQPMSFSPRDMDSQNQLQFCKKMIYTSLGVPMELVGESSTYENQEVARLRFYEDTIIPKAEDILVGLNLFLIPRYNDIKDKAELYVDKDNVDALSIKRIAMREQTEKSVIMTINEKREIFGLKPIAGGDKIVSERGLDLAGTDAKEPTVQQVADTNKSQKKSSDNGDNKPTRGDLIFLAEEIDSPTIYGSTSALAKVMYDELIQRFGKEIVDEIGIESVLHNTSSVNRFIETQSAELIKRIDDTTKDAIRKQLKDSFAAGETTSQIKKRIEGVFDDAMGYRANMIGVTESTRTAGFATVEAMEQAGIDGAYWAAVRDGKLRDSHKLLDGKHNDEEGYFHSGSHKAKHPGGFNVGKLDINCRCGLIPDVGQLGNGKALSDEYLTKMWNKRETKRKKEEEIIIVTMKKVFQIQLKAVLSRL